MTRTDMKQEVEPTNVVQLIIRSKLEKGENRNILLKQVLCTSIDMTNSANKPGPKPLTQNPRSWRPESHTPRVTPDPTAS